MHEAAGAVVLERMRNMSASMRAEADERESQDRKMLEAVEKIRTSLDRSASASEQEPARSPQHVQHAQHAQTQHTPPAQPRVSTRSLVFVNHALAPQHGPDMNDVKESFKEIDRMRNGGDASLKDLQARQEVQGNQSLIRRSPSEGGTRPGVTVLVSLSTVVSLSVSVFSEIRLALID